LNLSIAFAPLVPSYILWTAAAIALALAVLLIVARSRGALMRMAALALLVLALANPSFTREDREPLTSVAAVVVDKSASQKFGDRTQQGKAAPLSVDGVLTGREGDVPTGTAAAFPDAEANLLEPLERAAGEMQLGVGELSGRVALVVRCDLHGEFCRSHVGLL